MGIKKVTIGNATLYHGDCFNVLPTLGIQADAIISDPPFNCTNCKWDVPLPLDKFWTLMEQRTKETANIVLFGCGKFTYKLYNSKPDWHRYDVVWHKSKKVGHLNANKMPMRNHELIILFGQPGFRDASTYNPQKTLGGKVGIKTTNHRSSIYRDHGKYIHVSDGSLHPCSVLYFENEIGQHPTQKPVALMEWLVRTYTDENDIVLDCFMGSGSTGVAAINTGRRFIGIEKDKKYFDIACSRIEQAYKEVSNG